MKQLPIGLSSFKKLITNDYLYVDKTQHVYDLFSTGSYYFLSRPRRFGKSLLISTLKELFLGNKELFTNLWIGKNDRYQWTNYSVIHFDFSLLDIETSQELKISLEKKIKNIAEEHFIDLSDQPSFGLKLSQLIIKLSEINPVVVLIDEYDYPLINTLHTMNIAKAHHSVLRNFFTIIKGHDEYISKIFLTGVTKFAKTSIFSGMNNLEDISFDSSGASLLGYTQEEIQSNFSNHIQAVADYSKCTVQAIQEEMRAWYNGYRFSEEPIKVYNPFSVLNYLKRKKIGNYWFETGTPAFLIELLKKQYEVIEDIQSVQLSSSSLGTFNLEHLPIISVLFQTGYLTIKDYDQVTREYMLDYPNREVSESFTKSLVAAFVNADISRVEYSVFQLTKNLKEGDVDGFCTALQTLFAHIPYQLHLPQEKYYHSLFQLLGTLLGLDIQSEIPTDKGRIDLVLFTERYIYVIEIKLDASAAKALQQIEEQKYYEKYRMSKKKIILIGISFKRKAKRLTLEWQSKEI